MTSSEREMVVRWELELQDRARLKVERWILGVLVVVVLVAATVVAVVV